MKDKKKKAKDHGDDVDGDATACFASYGFGLSGFGFGVVVAGWAAMLRDYVCGGCARRRPKQGKGGAQEVDGLKCYRRRGGTTCWGSRSRTC